MKKFLPILLFFGLSIIVLLFLSNWKQPAKDVLDRSLWQVVEMENTPLLPDSTLTMRFHNQKVHGSSGCNTFKGTYTVKGDAISITLLERTSDNCMNPGIMQQERSFMSSGDPKISWAERSFSCIKADVISTSLGPSTWWAR